MRKLNTTIAALTMLAANGGCGGTSSGSTDDVAHGAEATESRIDAGAGAQPTSSIESNATSRRPDGGTDNALGPSLCDGSDTLRLLVAEQRGTAEFEYYRGWGYSYSWFVAIDGRCNYWVMGRPGVFGVRQGTLDSDAADHVASTLSLGEFDELYSKSVPGVADQGVVTLTWSGNSLTCPLAGCDDDKVDGVLAAAVALRDELVDDASMLTPSGIVSVRELDAVPLTSVVLPATLDAELIDEYPELPSDGSFRLLEVTDPDTLVWLRQQRDDFLESSFPVELELTSTTSNGTPYGMAYRDRVPFEALQGVFE